MILKMLMTLIYNFISFTFDTFKIPQMPEEIVSVLDVAKGYILQGVNILSVFLNMRLVVILCGIVGVIMLVDIVLAIIVWVLKKVPLAGMS